MKYPLGLGYKSDLAPQIKWISALALDIVLLEVDW